MVDSLGPVRPIEIHQGTSLAATCLRAVLSRKDRSTAITVLPELRYVQRNVILDPKKVAAYARVCGFGAVHGVPITYPQLLTFPLLMAFFASPACPWPAMGTVHLENRIFQRQALNPGDALRIEVSTGELLAHEKGQVMTLDMAIFREEELVWDATQSLLRTGIKSPTGPAHLRSETWQTPLTYQAEFSAPSNTGRRFGYISGDLNPIHVSALTARLFGFRRAIAHGMWTKARALATLMPSAPLSQAHLSGEFKRPLLLPASVSLWSAPISPISNSSGSFFEVRDLHGERPHLRGQLSYN